MSTELLKLIKKPLVTEKNATLMAEHNQYAFEVDYDANRPQIKRAIEKIFNVKVERVRTMIVRGKTKTYRSKKNKRPNWKKAYVTLQEGSKIEIFQGV
ncbi:MAG: 50S ribosomal protein L23 [Deltaproteobacteria bacterium RIFCSPHIGHO2_02_FULL_40_11]|nr:MAG: 50S ribosomal protein L23 [Deltaproteobacteria bacterium RIFCSPHIGHO2_02_FULL_40_11]